jgi:uncharacterized protein YwlG (UPF0340 family)
MQYRRLEQYLCSASTPELLGSNKGHQALQFRLQEVLDHYHEETGLVHATNCSEIVQRRCSVSRLFAAAHQARISRSRGKHASGSLTQKW